MSKVLAILLMVASCVLAVVFIFSVPDSLNFWGIVGLSVASAVVLIIKGVLFNKIYSEDSVISLIVMLLGSAFMILSSIGGFRRGNTQEGLLSLVYGLTTILAAISAFRYVTPSYGGFNADRFARHLYNNTELGAKVDELAKKMTGRD